MILNWFYFKTVWQQITLSPPADLNQSKQPHFSCFQRTSRINWIPFAVHTPGTNERRRLIVKFFVSSIKGFCKTEDIVNTTHPSTDRFVRNEQWKHRNTSSLLIVLRWWGRLFVEREGDKKARLNWNYFPFNW